jgi:hypothetical protein
MCDGDLSEDQLEYLRELRNDQKPHNEGRWSSDADAAHAAQVGRTPTDNAVATAS